MVQPLVVHSDDELAAVLGGELVNREPIRDWPLSLTERVELSDGRRYAYKSTLPPLIEPEFYAAAKSPLLPGHRYLGRLAGCSTMVIDWIDAPSVGELSVDHDQLRRHGEAVLDQLGRLSRGLPVCLDVGSPHLWTAEVARTLDKLRRLIMDGRFTEPGPEVINAIADWTSSAPVIDKIATESRVVHRDLKPEHILLGEDGYRVIDWQHPAVAPARTDLVWLLAHGGVDAFPYVDPADYGIAHFLHLRWAVVAAHDFFPEFTAPIFQDWATEGATGILRAAGS
ncbi:phosphotransferase [Microlunatus parietis]|uniref:Aminoglycoside phosphotransferase domain-containing protein n=1 Tax=Microlunatus parietis TaxID=682979 RepID=A0A7Y9I824_9ACTN|nr:phosphotransferase [Microlunatus parietis]NYE72024.1 hypothetical protein [Microlunatus parietis]